MMGGKFERYVIPVAIGFAPFVLLLLTWAPGGRSLLQNLTLRFYLPYIAVELFVVMIAMREGLLPAMRRWSWRLLPTTALCVLLVVAIGTALVAPAQFAAWLWTGFWLVHLLFGLSIAHLVAKGTAPRDLVLSYLAGFAVFAAGIFLFAASVHDPAFDWVTGWPAVTHIRHFGYYAAAMMAFCVGLAAVEQSTRARAMLFLLAVIGSTFVLWTGSRGAVAAIVGGMVVGLLVIPAIRRPVVWGGALLSLALGALIASQLPAHGPLMGFGRAVAQTVESGNVSTGRTVLWMKVIGAIRERPIFGYGENQMATVAPFYGLGQTHNVVLQVLLAWGVVGLACVTILAIWFLRRSSPVVRRDAAELAAPFMAMATLASLAAYDGSLFHVLPLSIFAACAGMIAARWRTTKVASR